MINKTLNITICLLFVLLFLYINTFSISVNDNNTYVTQTEFNSRITNVEHRIENLESSISGIISGYIANLPMNFEAGDGISITLNQLNNKWTISLEQVDVNFTLTSTNSSPYNVSGSVTCTLNQTSGNLTFVTSTVTFNLQTPAQTVITLNFNSDFNFSKYIKNTPYSITGATIAGGACEFTIRTNTTCSFTSVTAITVGTANKTLEVNGGSIHLQ